MSRDDIFNRSVEWRIEKYNHLKSGQREYEENCLPHLPYKVRPRNQGYFQLARLKIAESFKRQDRKAPPFRRVIAEFSEQSYELLLKLENSAQIDYLTVNDIANSLFNRDEQIFTIIKKWYNEEMDDFYQLFNPSEGNIKGSLISALMDVYNTRFKKINLGIIEYLRLNPGAPRKLFTNYERVLDAVHQAEIDRLKSERLLEAKLNHQKIVELEDRLVDLLDEKEGLWIEIRKATEAISDSAISPNLDDLVARKENTAEKFEVIVKELLTYIMELNRILKTLEDRNKQLHDEVETGEQEYTEIYSAEINRLKNRIAEIVEIRDNIQEEYDGLQDEMMFLEDTMQELSNQEDDSIEKEVSSVDAKGDEDTYSAKFIHILENEFSGKVYDPIRSGSFNYNPRLMHLRAANTTFKVRRRIDFDESGLPRNLKLECLVVGKRVLREDLKVKNIWRYHSHIESHVRHGFDKRKIKKIELLAVLDEEKQLAKSENIYRIIGVFSSTGFTDNLVTYIRDDYKGNYVSIVLIDKYNSELIYNQNDEVIKQFISLYDFRTKKEKRQNCEKGVLDKLEEREIIFLSDFVESECDHQLIKDIFHTLERRGLGKIHEVDDKIAFRRKRK